MFLVASCFPFFLAFFPTSFFSVFFLFRFSPFLSLLSWVVPSFECCLTRQCSARSPDLMRWKHSLHRNFCLGGLRVNLLLPPSDRRSIISHRISTEFWVSYVFNLMLLSTSWFCSSSGNSFLNAAILRSSLCYNLCPVPFLFVNMFVHCLPTSQGHKLSVRHLQCSIMVSINFCMH